MMPKWLKTLIDFIVLGRSKGWWDKGRVPKR